MTTEHTIALVTGANKGIGFETVRQLAGAGWSVWLGSRDADRGRDAVAKLEADGHEGSVSLLVLDVTDDSSVAAAVESVAAGGGLDVLVNNAGIAGAFPPVADTTPSEFLPVFGVNVLGPVRMTHAFLPLLRASDRSRIVNVSSGMGSFAVTTDPERFESTLHGLAYPSSKAALNMITTMYAKALPDVTVVAVDPGYTETDLNGRRGTQPVEVGARPVVQAATSANTPSGAFMSNDGPVAW